MMLDAFVTSLQTYYGADWASMLTGFAAAWMITNKNKTGFVLMVFSMILAAATAVIAGQYGFIAANIINIAIAVRGYINWRREEKDLAQTAPQPEEYAGYVDGEKPT